jgi:ribosome-associated toxin RatA of RatAB toxin-antitoxin module
MVPCDAAMVFDFVADYRNIPRLQPHFTSVELTGEKERGLGASVEMRGRFRGMPMHVRDRIITFTPPRRLVSISEGTVTSRNTWELLPIEGDTPLTRVTLRIDYKMGGGLLGGFLTSVASSIFHNEIQGMTDESLRRLREIVSGDEAQAAKGRAEE